MDIDEARKETSLKDSFFYTLPSGEMISTKDRWVQDVPTPSKHIPSDDECFFFDEFGYRIPDTEFLKNHFFNEGKLTHGQAESIIRAASQIFRNEPNLLELPAPATICGDIHGQYYDLLKLLEVGGEPDQTLYLFLGDYVDRGYFSIECLLLLWSYKIRYPFNFFLLRGNHECRHLTEYFTFRTECLKKYSLDLYEACIESFNCLPIACLMNKQFICIHGGVSPELHSLDDIRQMNRFREPPQFGLLCDLLWSDPLAEYGEEKHAEFFSHNRTRGCSYFYSFKAVTSFLSRNKLICLVRAHEAQDTGFRMYKQKEGFPSLITLFSAPNYLGLYRNKAAVLKYDCSLLNIRQFNCSPHPYWLPKFMDFFAWSLPFLGLKVTDMLLTILDLAGQDELEDSVIYDSELLLRKQIIRYKILAIGKITRLLLIVRDQADNISELKAKMGTSQLPPGYLKDGYEGIRKAIDSFEQARMADIENERLPPIMNRSVQDVTMDDIHYTTNLPIRLGNEKPHSNDDNLNS